MAIKPTKDLLLEERRIKPSFERHTGEGGP